MILAARPPPVASASGTYSARRRLEQHAVDDTEDGSGEPDAEGKDHDGGGAGAGPARGAAGGEADVG